MASVAMTPRRPGAARAVLACLFTIGFASAPKVASAQEEVAPILRGTLFLGDVPADTGTVVLHWVTPEESGVVDSTTVDDEGRFSLELPHLPIPNSSEVFFATSRFDDVLYTGSYITDPIQLDSVYAVRTYPSQAAPAEGFIFPVAQREVWIDAGPSGWRITDVLDIRNPNTVTFKSDGPDGVVWRYPLPTNALNPQIIQVGPIDGPARVDGTTLVAANTVVPSDNYYIVQYDLESIEFDLPLPGVTELIRMFVREPAPEISVTGLARQPPADEIEVGSTFDLWAAENLRDQTVRVRLGGEGRVPPVVWLVAALALILAGVGSWVIRRRLGDRPIAGRPRERRDVLVDVANLDEEYARLEAPTDKDEARYRSRRARLVRELSRTGDPGSVRAGR
jgi:hypothetical protein